MESRCQPPREPLYTRPWSWHGRIVYGRPLERKHWVERVGDGGRFSQPRLVDRLPIPVFSVRPRRSITSTSSPTSPFLLIPEVSSERRTYVPIGWLEPPVIPSNLVRVQKDATLTDFALLTSAMHMAWLRHGRAHQAIDRAADRLYRRTGFASERERAEHLFMLYEKMRTPLAIGIKKPKRRRR